MRAAAVLAVPAAIAALAPGAARAEIADKLDEVAPEVECASWAAGSPQQVTKLRGRVVVLHLSDPDGLLSKAALPALRKLAAAWKDAPVTVVEVVVAPTDVTATAYAAKELPPWPVGRDAKGTTAFRYAGTSVPRTYLIGPDGRIVWHAHVAALTKEIVQAQVDRVAYFVPSADVKKARGVARLAAEQRFGAALAEAAKVEADKYASDADRALCAAVRADVGRTWDLQKRLVDALAADLDWGVAWRRAERMKAIFAGTPREADANALLAELAARPIVPYVRQAQDQLDGILADVAKAKSRKDMEGLVARLSTFAATFRNTKPAERADAIRESLEKRLADASVK